MNAPSGSHLSPWDHAVVAVTLVLSAALGLYNGFFRIKVVSFTEYVLGSHTIPHFPIVMSTFATMVGAGYILGIPSEVYTVGITPIFQAFVWPPLILITNYVILPIYWRMSAGSIFEFYEIRFMKSLKQIVTGVYIAVMIFFASITLYGPSTAFNLATGIDVWIIVAVMNGLCMLYTVLGGMRAVVFADMIQGLEMLVAVVMVIVIGTINIGGIQQLWKINLDGRRIEQDFKFDFTTQHGFWSYSLGWTFSYVCYFTINQSFMQRLLACETLQQARRVNIFGICLMFVFHILIVYLGALVYTGFADCDPLLNGTISNYNQISPLYVIRTFRDYPGMAGLYFAAILSACLSSLSSYYNALAAICVESFVFPRYPNLSERQRTNTCKAIAFCYGILAIIGVLLIRRFPNVLQAVVNMGSIITVPTFALLLVGALCPQANKKGCIASFVIGVLLGVWLIAGELYVPKGFPGKPFSIEGCSSNQTLWWNSSSENYQWTTTSLTANMSEQWWATAESTTAPADGDENDNYEYWKILFPLYDLSYQWFAVVMFTVTFVLSIILTYILGREVADNKVVKLLPSLIQRFHRFLGPKWRHYLLCDSSLVTEDFVPPASEMGPVKLT